MKTLTRLCLGSNPRGTTKRKFEIMSDTKLHKEKGKTRRNVIEGTPLEVKLYFDRKCGKIDGKKRKKELEEKEIEKEDRLIKEEY